MPESSNTHIFVEKLLSPILENLNIKSDHNLNIHDSTTKGDGYVGRIWRAKIKQDDKTTDFVIKLATEDDEHRDFIKAAVLYRNEVLFYTKVFPAMDKLQKAKKVKHPFKIPKCYATSLQEKQEALVLEDLRAAGFQLHDRKKPVDEAHATLVLTQYGKFHALSFALRDQQPETFKAIAADLVDIFPLILTSFIQGFTSYSHKNVDMLQQQGLTAEAQLAERVCKEVNEIFFMQCDPEDPYNVITHGDCWNNNMMYTYDEETGKPVDHRFLDFQVSRLHSPAFDLSYFFYTSAPKYIMDDVDKYLQIYYKSFSDFLRQLGSDPGVMFPFEVLLKHWKRYRKFGLAMSMFVFRIMLSEEDETLCLTTKEALEDGLCKEMTNQKEHDKRLTDVLKHFVESNGI